MLIAPTQYAEMHGRVSTDLGLDRRAILIGVDGRDDHGKTSAASWLAWQFGMPALHLDLFSELHEFENAMGWRSSDLARCVKARGKRPLIIEGVLLLDALATIDRRPDFLVFVEKEEPKRARDRSLDDDLADPRKFSLSNQVSRYFERQNPSARADFKLVWTEAPLQG
jgi:uridine kinase